MTAQRIGIGIALLLLLLMPGLLRGQIDFSSSFKPESGSAAAIQMISPYAELPAGGYLPFDLTITNNAATARRWHFDSVANSGRVRLLSKFEFEVPPEATRTFRMLVPLPTQSLGTTSHTTLTITADGPGLYQKRARSHNSINHNATDFVGMSESLYLDHWGKLQQAIRKGKKGSSARELEGCSIDLELLAPDWRTFAGLSQLWLTGSEWRALTASVRAAIETWILMGGELVVVQDDDAVPGLPSVHGLGNITLAPGGTELIDWGAAHLQVGKDTVLESIAPGSAVRTAVFDEFGSLQPPLFLVLLFVILFAIVIGPLNFFVFAPPGKRARLFWTTPLISLAASLLMFGFILLLDGLGGWGSRSALLISAPEKGLIAMHQIQGARTGLLTSNGFVTPVPSLITQISQSPSNGNHSRDNSANVFRVFENQYSGDWFRSRAIQGQHIAATIGSRGRVRIKDPNTNPVAISEFEFPLAPFFWTGPDETVWTASRLDPGQEVRLEPSTRQHFENWVRKHHARLGPTLKSRPLDAAREGYFAAGSTDAPFLPTLPSIRWGNQYAFILGRASY